MPVIKIQPPIDFVHITDGAPNENQYNFERPPVDYTPEIEPKKRRGLMRFDLTEIPAGSTIHSAILYFHASFPYAPPSGSEFYAHRILEDWKEEEVTWNTAPSFDTAIICRAPIPTESDGHWISIDVTPIVEYQHRYERNFGILLKTNEDPEHQFYAFIYKYGSSPQEEPPYLEVDYSPPPATAEEQAGTEAYIAGVFEELGETLIKYPYLWLILLAIPIIFIIIALILRR